MPTVDIDITNGLDDGEHGKVEGADQFSNSTTQLRMWRTGDSNYGSMWFRFLNVTVPRNSSVSDARFRIYSTAGGTGTEWNTGVFQVDNYARPTTFLEVHQGVAIGVSGPSLVTGYNTSDDIKNPVQSVVNRAGWNSGQAMGVQVSVVTATDVDYLFDAFEHSSGIPPRLTITYTPPPVSLDQEGYRFRNDDGTETTATWLANQDVDVTATGPKRLRMLINAVSDPPSTGFGLQYKRVGDSTWDTLE